MAMSSQRVWARGGGSSRVVSASSSFLRFILSFNDSASRRAMAIFCVIDSALMSAMFGHCCEGYGVLGGTGRACVRGRVSRGVVSRAWSVRPSESAAEVGLVGLETVATLRRRAEHRQLLLHDGTTFRL